MASRTAIGIALACSLDLASVALCPSALRAAPGITPNTRQSGEPFGLPALPLSDGPLTRKWSALIHDLGDERVQLALCDKDRTSCPSSSAIKFLAIVDRARNRDGRARIGEVNRSINLAIRPMSDLAQYGEFDAWKSPLITFFNGAGDCEDYAVAKYVALREAGEAASNLRIVIVRDALIEEDHAVTAMRLDGRWLILDNRRMAIVEDTYARNYRPVFVFNEAGIWRYEDTSTPFAATHAGCSAR